MRAICRATLAVKNDGSCLGPMWLNERVTEHRQPELVAAAWAPIISCASLLRP